MAGLQQRLDAAFGALGGGGEAPAWKPSQQQIFRSGAPVNGGNSSDEEYEERQRRETMPGLAQSLVEEDAPDAEGFRPSTAFCRALDAEEEYNEVDEIATGLIARRRGREALPPRDTQVLDDNVYEQRAAAAEAAAAGEDQPAVMEVEQPADAAPAAAVPAAAPTLRRSSLSGRPSRSGSEEAAKEKKTVRFEGIAAPYVPPSRRPGYVPRSTELPSGPGTQPQRQSLSSVPDHVKHPDKYTCYVLDEPLVVGGGVGQLAGEQDNVRQAWGASEPAAADEPEPERWEGPVGVAGAVQFRPRQRASGAAASAQAAEGSSAAAGAAAGKRAAQPAVAAAFDDGGVEEGGEDAAMPDAEPQPKGKQRHYRTSRRVSDDTE